MAKSILALIAGPKEKGAEKPPPEEDDDDSMLAKELFAALDSKDETGVVEAIRAIARG